MTQPAHISDDQMTRYANRELSPVELLDLDTHLLTCDTCRDRVYVRIQTSAAIESVRSELSEHLQYADVLACTEGSSKPAHLAHIRGCAKCQAEVLDLRRFRTVLAKMARFRGRPDPPLNQSS